MKIRFRTLVAPALVCLSGCGGSTTPGATGPAAAPAPGGSAAPTIATGPMELAAPGGDLSAAVEPPGLVAVARVRNPAGVLDTLSHWVGMPIDWRRLAAREVPGLDSVVLLDAPIEAAVALDPRASDDMPQPFAAMSLGLRSLEEALRFAQAHGRTAHQKVPGVYVFDESGSPQCARARARGQAPARLVCGDRQSDVDALLEYMTRGLPDVALSSNDLHFEVRAGALRKTYGELISQARTLAVPAIMSHVQLDDPRFDRALSDAVHAVADETMTLLTDVDKLTFDVTLDQSAGAVDTSVGLRFDKGDSWTVQTIVEAAKRGSGPPDMFWKLPKDAGGASFGRSAHADRFVGMRRSLAELANGALEHFKVPRGVRDQATDLIEELFKLEGTAVYATGAVQPNLSAGSTDADRQREKLRASIGWHVVGYDLPQARLQALFDRMLKLYNDPVLRGEIAKLHMKKGDLPPLKARASKGLAGGRTYELTLPGAMFESGAPPGTKKQKGKALSVVLVLLADGATTWVAVAADEALAVQRLGEVKKGGGLAQREGVAALRATTASTGGFLTVAGALASAQASMSGDDALEVARTLTTLPHHGETPLPYTFKVDTSGGTTLTYSLQIPKASFEDAHAAMPAFANARHGLGI